MKIVLQIDGGDLKGIMPAYILKYIEEQIQGDITKKLDLVTGVSTGAVIGGTKAFGIPAARIYELYTNEVVSYFQKAEKQWYNPFSWLSPVYDVNLFLNALKKELGDKTKLGEVQVPFTTVAFGLCKNASHFIKSWKDEDNDLNIIDVISWSALSAAWFFGAIKAPNYKWKLPTPEGELKQYTGEVFQDGGQGTQNCTVMYDLVEVLAKDWDEEEVHILSLGCGSEDQSTAIVKYEKAINTSYLNQVLKFTGQARAEATVIQVGAGEYVAGNRKNIHFYRIDCTLPKAALEFGAFKYKDLYMAKAVGMAKKVPLDIFK